MVFFFTDCRFFIATYILRKMLTFNSGKQLSENAVNELAPVVQTLQITLSTG